MWRHSSSTSQDTSEHDWNILLGLDYTKRLILVQGFPVVAVRDALCEQILQTGIPFSREVDCTSAVRKKIESYEEKNNNKLLTAERIANYRTVYAVMRFIQMVMGKSYNRSYPTGCIENSVYLYKQSAFNDSGDPNIPMYRHEISFNLPYPDHTYTGYHIESEYRMTLDRLNSYEITSRISSILDQEQSASLTAIWGYLVRQTTTTKKTNTSASNVDRGDITNALDSVGEAAAAAAAAVDEEEELEVEEEEEELEVEEEEEEDIVVSELENQSAIGITIAPVPTMTPIPTVHTNGRDLIFHTRLYIISNANSRRVVPYQNFNSIIRGEPDIQHRQFNNRDEEAESKLSRSTGIEEGSMV